MKNQFWKRELFNPWKENFKIGEKLLISRSIRSSASPVDDTIPVPSTHSNEEYVVSKQTPEESQNYGKFFWKQFCKSLG